MNCAAIKREFGRRVKKARNDKRLTQEAFAKKCGMKVSKMDRLESGLVNPALITVIRIAKTLDISLDQLLIGIP